MFQVCVVRRFIAQHFLIGGDWGAENQRHSHAYRLEAILEGPELDKHRYLVDIVDVERSLDEQVVRFRERTLNELPEFESVNPSLELFAQILCRGIAKSLDTSPLSRLTVRLWENEDAWASFEERFEARTSDGPSQ